MLQPRRPARRPARGRAARHSRTTSSTSKSEFRRTVVEQLRRRIRRGPHAHPLRALQRRSEVRDAGRARRRASTPPPWPPATTPASPSTRIARRYRLLRGVDRGQGPVVLPVLADAGPARARALPGRPPDQARGARRTPRASGCSSPTSRTATRSASFRTATPPASSSGSSAPRPRTGDDRRLGRTRARPARGRPSLHGRSAQGPRPLDRRAAVRAQASSPTPRRVVVGPREELGRSDLARDGRELDRRRSAHSSRAASRRASAIAIATRPRSSRADGDDCASRASSTSRRWRSRRDRRWCSTTETKWSAVGGSDQVRSSKSEVRSSERHAVTLNSNFRLRTSNFDLHQL